MEQRSRANCRDQALRQRRVPGSEVVPAQSRQDAARVEFGKSEELFSIPSAKIQGGTLEQIAQVDIPTVRIRTPVTKWMKIEEQIYRKDHHSSWLQDASRLDRQLLDILNCKVLEGGNGEKNVHGTVWNSCSPNGR